MGHDQKQQPASLDPIALTLALWLGVVAGVSGLDRLRKEAAAQAALRPPAATPVIEGGQAPGERTIAFGGQ